MKHKIKYIIAFIIVGYFVYLGYGEVTAIEYISQNQKIEEQPSVWNSTIAHSINSKKINMYVDGNEITHKIDNIYMDKTMTLMIPSRGVVDSFDCAVNIYPDGSLTVERGTKSVSMQLGSLDAKVNSDKIKLVTPPVRIGDLVYIPLSCIIENFGYTYSWNVAENKAILINDSPQERSIPYSYCYADVGRLGDIKNQGYYGTCWATAALSALESSLLPTEKAIFSADHMSINNSYDLSQYNGGDYCMALAYLAAWQGPVLEADDPYGDGVSDSSLVPVKHMQEAIILPSKDYETIKKMVYKYGGVTTSLYTSLNDSYSQSRYYNKSTSSYCYIGESKPNHDVVIVGWDDNYPKENFNAELEGNGAFICQNSWGTNFGNEGLFYVSYYDTNIGIHNVVYTGLENPDNYDKIYQTDLCGWRGNLGYDKESAYFANVYQTTGKEELEAVSFYAVDVDTYYEIGVCRRFSSSEDLNGDLDILASGTLKYSGYYTIELDESVILDYDEKYAIVMYISTPNATRPIAVEVSVASDYTTHAVDTSDGEGYISYTGRTWERVEEKYNCNLCLKGFTSYK